MSATLEGPAVAGEGQATHAVRRARRAPRNRLWLVAGSLGAALFGLFALRVLAGDFIITPADFVKILGGQDIPNAPSATFILMESKLPRAVLGVLAGVAFGTAGAIFQSTLRNPLASPDMLGISLGASAAAVFAIVVLSVNGSMLSVVGVVGAILTAAVIRGVAGSDGGYRLVLVGVTAAAALLAVIQYLFTRAAENDAQRALRWMTGSLSDATWPTIRILAVCLLVLLPLVAWTVKSQRVLELGPDVARALGVTHRYADLLLLLAVLLCALAVAACGPVAFVAFVAGPIARVLNGGRTTLLGAGLVGAIVMVGSDYLAAYAIPDTNLPVGVVTGAFGAPFLMWLLASGRAGRR
ncbi:iron complex transport system permease protein [Nocardioides albertanoniae]|uniref:Iron complex transport system permease protein n=1 Tax=Nocardioides albertanoniae TaxID=1175486 RepID=A0A543A2G3_9ACTN|nr:iron ABC transporter permease [Nocardioides albertanoniae]TQL66772.1 iron complex transport system permease protein [Nocardioides albertanoniae]